MNVSLRQSLKAASRYGFAVGKVRVLESRTLPSTTFERLLDAPNFFEQRRILSDTYYGRYLERAETPEDVERALAAALEDAYRLLGESGLPDAITRFFRVRHDYANLKAALKSHVLGIPVEDLLVPNGALEPEVFSGPLDELLRRFAAASVLAKRPDIDQLLSGTLPEGERLQAIDIVVDRAMFEELIELACIASNQFMLGLVRLTVDLANLKTMVRTRRAGTPASALSGLLIDGGSVEVRELEQLYSLPPAEIVARLCLKEPALREAAACEMTDVSRLDVVSDDVVRGYLHKAQYIAAGPEPVVAYVMGRESEVAGVRTLLLGKLSGLPHEMLRQRLRDTGA